MGEVFITLPAMVWGQIVFAVQEGGDARLNALIDQAIAEAGNVETTMWGIGNQPQEVHQWLPPQV